MAYYSHISLTRIISIVTSKQSLLYKLSPDSITYSKDELQLYNHNNNDDGKIKANTNAMGGQHGNDNNINNNNNRRMSSWKNESIMSKDDRPNNDLQYTTLGRYDAARERFLITLRYRNMMHSERSRWRWGCISLSSSCGGTPRCYWCHFDHLL